MNKDVFLHEMRSEKEKLSSEYDRKQVVLGGSNAT